MRLNGHPDHIPLDAMMRELERHGDISKLSFEQQAALLQDTRAAMDLYERVIGLDIRYTYPWQPEAGDWYRQGSVGRATGMRFENPGKVHLLIEMEQHVAFKTHVHPVGGESIMRLRNGGITIAQGYDPDAYLAIGIGLRMEEVDLLGITARVPLRRIVAKLYAA